MSAGLLVAAGLYVVAGRFWWRRVIVAGPVRGSSELWRADLAGAEARGEFSVFIVKAAFILLWPVALGWGWLAAQTGGDP